MLTVRAQGFTAFACAHLLEWLLTETVNEYFLILLRSNFRVLIGSTLSCKTYQPRPLMTVRSWRGDKRMPNRSIMRLTFVSVM